MILKLNGVSAALLSALFAAIMGALYYQAHLTDPEFSSATGTLVRVLSNGLFVLIPWVLFNNKPQFVSPMKARSLWLWGFFGALTVITFFAAIPSIGNGRAAFLGATSGIFIIAFAPLLAGQSNKPVIWLSLFASLLGVALICDMGTASFFSIGNLYGAMAGLFSGIAYLMVARARDRYSTSTIMFYWCWLSTFALVAILLFTPQRWPHTPTTWSLLIAAGICAGFAQFYITRAFQTTSAGLVACLSYLAPVFSLGIDKLYFQMPITHSAMSGAALIVGFGIIAVIQREKISK